MLANNQKIFIEKSKELITAKTGLLSIVATAKDFGVIDEIKNRFNKKSNASYSPEIPIIAFVLCICGGGYKIEDVTGISNDQALLKLLGLTRSPNPDTIINFLKTKGNIKLMNKVMDRFRMTVIKKSELNEFTYDIDATLIKSDKDCASYCYKEFMAMQSLMGFFSEIDLCVTDEYRTGSVYPGWNTDKQLIKTLAMLKLCKKKMKYLRADSAAHNIKVFKICERHKIKFLIALKNTVVTRDFTNQIPVDSWKPIFDKKLEYTEVDYAETMGWVDGLDKPIRMLIKRRVKREGFLTYYDYYVIGTNDFKTEALELIKLYNLRGAAENYNKEIKSGFNLEYTPFNELETNSLYFKIGLLAFNLVSVLKHFYLKGVWIKHTITTIRWKLLFVAGKVIYRSRMLFLKVASTSDYIFYRLKWALC